MTVYFFFIYLIILFFIYLISFYKVYVGMRGCVWGGGSRIGMFVMFTNTDGHDTWKRVLPRFLLFYFVPFYMPGISYSFIFKHFHTHNLKLFLLSAELCAA